jgi:hypothetical protein
MPFDSKATMFSYWILKGLLAPQSNLKSYGELAIRPIK